MYYTTFPSAKKISLQRREGIKLLSIKGLSKYVKITNIYREKKSHNRCMSLKYIYRLVKLKKKKIIAYYGGWFVVEPDQYIELTL